MLKLCENCKYKSNAVEYDKNFRAIAFYCKKEKTWMPVMIYRCENYDANLHDDDTAPNNTQARNNGIHQE